MNFNKRVFFVPKDTKDNKFNAIQFKKLYEGKARKVGAYYFDVYAFEYLSDSDEIRVQKFTIYFQPATNGEQARKFHEINQVVDLDDGHFKRLKDEIEEALKQDIRVRIFNYNDHILENAKGRAYLTRAGIGTFNVQEEGTLEPEEHKVPVAYLNKIKSDLKKRVLRTATQRVNI